MCGVGCGEREKGGSFGLDEQYWSSLNPLLVGGKSLSSDCIITHHLLFTPHTLITSCQAIGLPRLYNLPDLSQHLAATGLSAHPESALKGIPSTLQGALKRPGTVSGASARVE